MSRLDNITTDIDPSESDSNDAAPASVLSRLLLSLARLCVANGITFSTAEEVMKQAFVQAAGSLQAGSPAHGTVSSISTVTGINRREVTRLTKLSKPERRPKQPLAAELFACWTTENAWRGEDGLPLVLKRQGTTPSFEALAQSITRDVHPRSMLDELIRLGLAKHDETLDLVSLTRNDFVPRNDSQQMLNFLGNNVGDHLDAAVTNILSNNSKHHEQAVFADELSAESIDALSPLIVANWQALRDSMVPAITALIEEDRIAGRRQNQRVRIGLYSYNEPVSAAETPQNKPVKHRYRKLNSKDKPR